MGQQKAHPINSMAFKPTITVLNVLKARLEALQWTPPGEGAEPEPAFERVELFDMSDLEAALRELLVFKGRCCFIILDSERFDNSTEGQKLLSRQVRTVVLMIADRNYAKRQKAMVGDSSTPGVLVLKDLVLNGEANAPEKSVLGLMKSGAENLGVVAVPVSGSFVGLRDEGRDNLPGRLAWSIDLELRGGWFEVRMANLAPVM